MLRTVLNLLRYARSIADQQTNSNFCKPMAERLTELQPAGGPKFSRVSRHAPPTHPCRRFMVTDAWRNDMGCHRSRHVINSLQHVTRDLWPHYSKSAKMKPKLLNCYYNDQLLTQHVSTDISLVKFSWSEWSWAKNKIGQWVAVYWH